ncbi:MAG TPA: endolytic transglycosylase MltG, partial [Desulfuromonadales bacterium]|nr:endolytic transglycosylase MltG [Desulfuromonadales bacterium]
MTKSPLKIALLGLLLVAVCAGAAGFRFYVFLHRSVAPSAPVTLTVKAGEPFRHVARQLQDAGVVGSAFEFRLLGRLRGTTRKVQAGTYAFREPAPPGRVLARLVAGDVVKVRITIPEGFTLKEIAARVASAGFGTTDDFLRLAHDPEFVRSLGIDAPSLEGYLFPETYTFAPGVSQRQIAEAMVRELATHLTPDLLKAAAGVGLNKEHLLTLASIIQKETGKVEEMALISAVFHNRLKRHMPLQSDPTVIYGIADFDGNLTRKDL